MNDAETWIESLHDSLHEERNLVFFGCNIYLYVMCLETCLPWVSFHNEPILGTFINFTDLLVFSCKI